MTHRPSIRLSLFSLQNHRIIIENKIMRKSDTQRLLEMSEQLAKLQQQMHEILKNGSLKSEPRQAISPDEIVDQRLLAVIQPEMASKQVGEMLRVFRESVGMTQVAVAKAKGKSTHREVRKTELGENSPTLKTLAKHSEAIGASLLIGLHQE